MERLQWKQAALRQAIDVTIAAASTLLQATEAPIGELEEHLDILLEQAEVLKAVNDAIEKKVDLQELGTVLTECAAYSLKTCTMKTRIKRALRGGAASEAQSNKRQHLQFAPGDELQGFLNFLKTEVESRERAECGTRQEQSTDRLSRPSRKDIPEKKASASVLTAVMKAETQCKFCEASSHSTADCDVDLPADQKRAIVQRERLCFSRHSERKIRVEALEIPQICCDIVPAPEGSTIKYLEEQGLELADGTQDEAEIGLLLGSDYYWEVTTGSVRRLDSGFVAAETIFGWTLQGTTHTTELTATYVSTVGVLRVAVIDEQDQDDTAAQLKSFWQLEHIGIVDGGEADVENDGVLREFRENVSRSNC
ncbi:hypothetical protein HPB49_022387 [Dermacentor silvarum]|uniref:Uncharacterized protein n=1 Tax=Dermacentor silvarum TaxID=543639 RepID=A0ACB8C5T1_DERSI|nr:hypothetical protein HPB49_022387 [Dermacentor silvarum]